MIAALLMLAQLAPVLPEPKPVATSIAAIRGNPKKFDGQIVRLRGWVNSCQALSCAIEERAANAPAGAGERLSIASNAKFDETLKPLIPTYVEFDARLDATCLTTAVCSDRAPVLTIVSLRSVVSPEPPSIEN
jgi:hypothetical protein